VSKNRGETRACRSKGSSGYREQKGIDTGRACGKKKEGVRAVKGPKGKKKQKKKKKKPATGYFGSGTPWKKTSGCKVNSKKKT